MPATSTSNAEAIVVLERLMAGLSGVQPVTREQVPPRIKIRTSENFRL